MISDNVRVCIIANREVAVILVVIIKIIHMQYFGEIGQLITESGHKSKLTVASHFDGHLGYRSSNKIHIRTGESRMKVIHIMNFKENR